MDPKAQELLRFFNLPEDIVGEQVRVGAYDINPSDQYVAEFRVKDCLASTLYEGVLVLVLSDEIFQDQEAKTISISQNNGSIYGVLLTYIDKGETYNQSWYPVNSIRIDGMTIFRPTH